MSSHNKAIGGYFELELPPAGPDFHKGGLKYQSARSAFLSLLTSMPDVKRVWMPYYICDSMLAPVQSAGKEIIYYSIDEKFNIKDDIELSSNEILLYVNYFGICSSQVKNTLQRLNPMQVVIDCSQAFYAEPSDCLATIYSPRKFFGIPDGGLLVTGYPVMYPDVQDNSSEDRMKHLIHRLALPPESGYENYQKAENSLLDIEPKRMSALTDRLLGSIQYDTIKRQRLKNFLFLHEHLGTTNHLNIDINNSTPLCYHYLPKNPIKREALIKNKIYTATYWPDVLNRAPPLSTEKHLAQYLIAIPCDQRYKENDLTEIIKAIKNETHY